MDSLYTQIHHHYAQFLHRIGTHSHPNYAWMHPHHQKFILQPDYLTLSQFASHPHRVRINKTAAKAPALWAKFIWPRIHAIIAEKLEFKYFPDISRYHQTPLHPQRTKPLLHVLQNILTPGQSKLTHATYTDLYFFLNEVLKSFCQHLHINTDIYEPAKKLHTQKCLSIYTEIRNELLNHPNAFEIGAFLSIRANWIDCVEDHVENYFHGFKEEINQVLDTQDPLTLQKNHNPYFHLAPLKEKLSTPQHILYELDNHGEVLFDLLWIEYLLSQGHTITLAAKDQPVLNDVTYSELKTLLSHPNLAVLQPYQAKAKLSLINTHSSIAGKYLPHASIEYQKAYQIASLLILKGQGNFQTMPMGKRIQNKFIPYPFAKPIVYMMGVKAPFILACFTTIQTQSPPKLQTPFLYYFDPLNKKHFPQDRKPL